MKRRLLIPVGIGLCILLIAIFIMINPASQHTNIAEEQMAGSVKTGESSNINNDSGFIE